MTTTPAAPRALYLPDWVIEFLALSRPADHTEVRLYIDPNDLRGLTRIYTQAELDAAVAAEREKWRAEVEPLLTALRFYARSEHYMLDEDDEFDTVSGEPDNWMCSGRSATMVEDGLIARSALKGEPINWIEDDDDNTPQPIEGEKFAAIRNTDTP